MMINLGCQFDGILEQCGGLNEICPYRLRHLDRWSPVGGAVSGSLKDVILLEEVSHWECKSVSPQPTSSLLSAS